MMMNRVGEYLDLLFPNPRCELVYHTDYELLISIVLSAQSTDKRVNQVTSILFQQYPSLEALSSADLSELEKIIRPVGSFRKKSFYVKEIARIVLESYDSVVPRNRDILITFPACSAFISFINFIASMIQTTSPTATVEPTSINGAASGDGEL